MIVAFLLALVALVIASFTRKRVRTLSAQVHRLEIRVDELTAARDSASSAAARWRSQSPAIAPEPRPAGPVTETVAPAAVAPVPPPPPELQPAFVAQDAVAAEAPRALPPPLPSKAFPASAVFEQVEQVASAKWTGARLEQFVGVRLFAWLGGLALFFAAAMGLKYSFDHGLFPTWLRAVSGIALGLGLVGGGSWAFRKGYVPTATTLWGTGVVILHAVFFACRSLYAFALFTPAVTFGSMVLTTVLAFALAVRHRSQVVAILGLVGGFATPALVSSGRDQGLVLFVYMALLDLGLLAISARRQWPVLPLLAAIGSGLLQAGWFASQYQPEKAPLLQFGLILFPLLFSGFVAWMRSQPMPQTLPGIAAGISAMVTLLLSLFVAHGSSDVGTHPVRWCWGVFVADAALCWVAWVAPRLRRLETLGGGATFFLLGSWILGGVNAANLYWALGLMMAYALVHSATPVAWAKWRSDESSIPRDPWLQIAPALSIIGALLCIVREVPVGPAFWAAILLLDLVVFAVAAILGGILGLLAALILTVALSAVWLLSPGSVQIDLAESVAVIGTLGLVFAGLSSLLIRPGGRLERSPGSRALPALSAALPFVLLALCSIRLEAQNPWPVLGTALVFTSLLLVLRRWLQIPSLGWVALGASALLVALATRIPNSQAAVALLLAAPGAFFLLFLAHPLILRDRIASGTAAWGPSALAGPVFFGITHWICRERMSLDWPGIEPLPFLAGAAAVMTLIWRRSAPGDEGRLPVLSWFGGCVLFLATAILPLQLKSGWLTVAFALEGTALCWLFHRLPHPGLRATGMALLVLGSARLLTDRVLHGLDPRPDSVFNQCLYTFGVVIALLFVAARLLAPPRDRVLGSSVPPLFRGAAVFLGFILMNLEIAIAYGTGGTVSWEFSGNFARDLAYSIGWACFAFGLVLAGLLARARAARYSGLALLGITLVKLFLHDLSSLGPLHRIGAFAGVAVVAIIASLLYQRFLANSTDAGSERPDA